MCRLIPCDMEHVCIVGVCITTTAHQRGSVVCFFSAVRSASFERFKNVVLQFINVKAGVTPL